MPKVTIDSLTGLRFWAALWVVLMHFREYKISEIWQFPYIDKFISQGALGVDLFFVLSGFILCHVYKDIFGGGVARAGYLKFLRYRIARLYPVHIVTLAFMVALFALQLYLTGQANNPERFSLVSIISSLTLTHAWFPGVSTPNMPAWSISAEAFAYLLFPFLTLIIYRVRLAVIWFAGAGLFLLWFMDSGYFQETIVSSSILRVSGNFLLGMVAFTLNANGGEIVSHAQKTSILSLLSIAILFALTQASVSSGPFVSLIFMLMIVALADSRDMLGKFLSFPVFIYLGEVSYSLYMVHWPVRTVLRNVVERSAALSALSPPVIIAIYVGFSMAAAVLTYHMIEKPGRTFLRGLGRVRRERMLVPGG